MRGEDIMGKITGICISEMPMAANGIVRSVFFPKKKLMHLRQKEQISIQDLLAKT